jgi:hypothetical protein
MEFPIYFYVSGPYKQKCHQIGSTVKCAEQNLKFNLSQFKFVWGVPLGCKISKLSYQNWHQICSTVKFVEQNLRFNLT